MSKVEVITPVNWQTVSRMKRYRLEETCMLFVEASVAKDAEIERLQKEIKQLRESIKPSLVTGNTDYCEDEFYRRDYAQAEIEKEARP